MYRLPQPSPEAEGRPFFPVAAVQVGGKELDAGARLRELSRYLGIPIYRDRFPADDGLHIIN